MPERVKTPIDPVGTMLRIARTVRSHVVGTGTYCDPQGRCYEAGIEISRRLARVGIPHEVVGGWYQSPSRPRGHVWVRFPQYGGAILDVTADQFDPTVPGVWYPADPDRYVAREVIPVKPGRPRRITPIMYGKIWPAPVPTRKRNVKVRSSLRRRTVNHLKHPPSYCLCHKSKTVNNVRKGLVKRLDK